MEEDQLLVSFHGEAYHEDGRCIDTRTHGVGASIRC